ncbi:MAG: hypothetical protein M1812_004936 [Candelaria pacifica]|nr:MAG: hypothetical protein M1812_004936 [Candelaria pacifica]
MAQHSYIEKLDVQAVWAGEKHGPVDVNIKLQIRTKADSKIPIFRYADKHVIAATPLMPRLVAAQSPAGDCHSSVRDCGLTASPRRRLFPGSPVALYDLDLDSFNDFGKHSAAGVDLLARSRFQTSLRASFESPSATPQASESSGHIRFIDLSETRREPSGAAVDILLPTEPSSLFGGSDEDSDSSSVTLVRHGGLEREARSSISPEPATMPNGDLRVPRKRSRFDPDLNNCRSSYKSPVGSTMGYDNGGASTSSSSSGMRAATTREHSRILSEVRNVSHTVKSIGAASSKFKHSTRKPQWQSPSQADFSPNENRKRLAASPNAHNRSPAGEIPRSTPPSSRSRGQKQKANERPSNQVREDSPPSSPKVIGNSMNDVSMSKSMRDLERIAQWRNDCPSGVVGENGIKGLSICEDAPKLTSLGSIIPINPPTQRVENECLPFTLEESGIIWAFCPSDVMIGVFELEIRAKIMVSPEIDTRWQSLQIPGLPLQDNLMGHVSFAIKTGLTPAVEFDTTTLENALVTDTSMEGEFSLAGPLWLGFRLKQRIYQPQNYSIRCDLQAMLDWTTTEGVWAMYKAAIELPKVSQNVFAEQSSITLLVSDGPREAAAYRLGTNERNESICLTPSDGKGGMDLMVNWSRGNDSPSVLDLCFDVFLGKPPRAIVIPTITAQGGKIEQGVRVMEPMPPLLIDFPLHLVPASWEHKVQRSSVGKIHEFVRKTMPRTFPSDLEAGLKARISALESAVFSDLVGTESPRDIIQVMRIKLCEIQGADTKTLECELSLNCLVTHDTVDKELISFISVDWTPKIAFVNGHVAEEGQFYINKNGELALFRTENLRSGKLATLEVIWVLETSNADLQSYDTDDSAVIEYDLPRIVRKSVLRPSLECNLQGASMVSYSPPNGSVSHRFEDGKVVKLPRLHPGYRLVVEKPVIVSDDEDHQHPISTPMEDDGKGCSSGLVRSRPRKNVRFAMDEKAESVPKARSSPMILTAFLTVLLLGMMAGIVDHLGLTGKVGLHKGLGRLNGTFPHLSSSLEEHHVLPTIGNAIVSVPIPNKDEGQFSNSFSIDSPDTFETGGVVAAADSSAEQRNDASMNQRMGFRDMIDYALGWRG